MQISEYFDVAMGLKNPNIRLCKTETCKRNNFEYGYKFQFNDGIILVYWVKKSKEFSAQCWFLGDITKYEIRAN